MSDIINKLSGIQSQVWQTVSQTVTDACQKPISFQNPLTVATQTADMYGEISAPMLVIQFAYSTMPENAQVILIPQDTFADLAGLIKGEMVEEIDENLVADVRGALESIVQGVCLSVGMIRNDPVVATGLSIRFQIFSFPQNLQRAEEIVRMQVAVTSEEGLNGTAIWLMDSESAQFIVGAASTDDEEEAPFAQVEGTGSTMSRAERNYVADETGGLDLLMDIPLEISVELGRVKMQVRDVIELGTGSIIEIDKAAGEPVDVMVNGRLVARGEVVVIEDNFGVRITEILTAQERLAKLGDAA